MYHASIFFSLFMSYYTSTVWVSSNFVLKQLSYSLMVKMTTQEINTNIMELLDNNMNTSLENFNSSDVHFHGFIPTSGDNFSDHHQRSHPISFTFNGDHQSDNSIYDPMNHFPSTMVEALGLQRDHGMATMVESFMNANPPPFGPGCIGEINKGHCGKKRKKNNEAGEEKPREVVHVRAKRGEATDSHSLAERMRREKINEKLRRLQDLVPGCYKTMGMSVMLDVIINYVGSLQHQIEFLSMKLSAASMFYDFNTSEIDPSDVLKEANGHEAQIMEKMIGEGYGDLSRFQPTWSP